MVKSGETLPVAPFLKKCYEMLDDDSTDSIISWSHTGDSFIIWDMPQFSAQLLPKYFKHNNSSSFIRQLNIYGFRKVDTDRWEFANDGFIQGKIHLLKNISRRKNSQVTENRKFSQQQESSGEPGDKNENEGIWKEIENLKTDKNALMQELVKLRQCQENADNKLLLLKDRVQGMEKNQQQMLSFLVMVVQSPGFLIQLLNPKENNWRMAEPGSIIEEDEEEEQLASDGMIVRYQPPAEEMTTPMVTEIPQESDPFYDGIKDPVISPDFVKFLMDENFSFENHASLVLPEIPDESTWEQIFMASHFLQNVDDRNQDGEVPNTDKEIETAEPGTQVDPLNDSKNSGYSMERVDKFQSLGGKSICHEPHSEKAQNLEIVTKQMARLASETNQEK
ncbi:heat stress transcription factor A-8 [Euphorbia lathyris]|uniref:heat stress transcription factor A-8 n=1 Tax=Euphorbia lathyris TaxID=212925 RepID=UPI0033141061